MDTKKTQREHVMMSLCQSPSSPQLSPQTTYFLDRETAKGRCLDFSSFTLYKTFVIWPLPTLFSFYDIPFLMQKLQSHYPLDFLSLTLPSDVITVLLSASDMIFFPHIITRLVPFHLNLSSNITPSENSFSDDPI